MKKLIALIICGIIAFGGVAGAIYVIAKDNPQYSITAPTGDGFIFERIGDTGNKIKEGKDFIFKITVLDTHEGTPVVKANGETLTALNNAYTIANVREDKTITVSGLALKTIIPPEDEDEDEFELGVYGCEFFGYDIDYETDTMLEHSTLEIDEANNKITMILYNDENYSEDGTIKFEFSSYNWAEDTATYTASTLWEIEGMLTTVNLTAVCQYNGILYVEIVLTGESGEFGGEIQEEYFVYFKFDDETNLYWATSFIDGIITIKFEENGNVIFSAGIDGEWPFGSFSANYEIDEGIIRIIRFDEVVFEGTIEGETIEVDLSSFYNGMMNEIVEELQIDASDDTLIFHKIPA